MPYKDLTDGQILSAAGSFAAICGWLNYLLNVQEGKMFSWREFFLHGAISAMAGLISYELLVFNGLPPNVCGALSGLAGWSGTRLLRLIELVIQKKLGVSKEDLNDK